MATQATRKAIGGSALTGGAQAAWCGVMIIALAVTAATARSAEAKGDAKSEHKLVGTWKLVTAKYGGEAYEFEEGTTTIKHVTTAQFMWASYDKDGKVTRAAGGTTRSRATCMRKRRGMGSVVTSN